MNTVKIVHALDEYGMLVHPSNAMKNTMYKCIGCGAEVYVRSGDVNAPHFAHFPNSVCNIGEGEIHKYAKLRIRDHINSNNYLEYTSKCVKCSNVFTNTTFPNGKAVDEWRMTTFDDRTIIPDVAVLDNDQVVFIVEIYNTHHQDNRPEPWIELNVWDVINGTIHNIRDSLCDQCIKQPTGFTKCDDVGTCDGSGFCWRQSGNCDSYIKDYQCVHSCPLFPCARCKELFPKHILDLTVIDNYCIGCDVDCYDGSSNPRNSKPSKKFCGYCKKTKESKRLKCRHYACVDCANVVKCRYC